MLTALGIAIGIAAMVSVLGISSSSRADLLARLDRLGTNLLEVKAGQSFMGDTASLPDTAAAMIRRVAPVEGASSVQGVSTTVRRTDRVSKSETGGIAVKAAEPSLLDTLGGHVRAGRFLDDATARYPAVVLGAKTAEVLGIDSLDGGPRVWIGDRWYAVVGILDPIELVPTLDRAAFIGFPEAMATFGIDGAPSTIYVRAAPDRVEAVRDVLSATANPKAPNEVQVTRPSDALEARAATDQAFTALLLGLGGVALVVGGVGIANVMVISVLERRTEVGVRRALGATRRHILVQFLIEAVLLSGLGGATGALAGTVLTYVYAGNRGWLVSVPAVALVAGVGAALAIGGLAGLYPAARAARLAPADAVRPA
jgi:putative ABC transport system permease protein